MRHTARSVGLGAILVWAMSCVPVAPPKVAGGPPKYPAYPVPDVPATLRVTAETRNRQALGWQRLQAGDLRGAQRDFNDLLKRQPAFYPAETGLGFVSLADRQFKPAAARFQSAITKNDRYLPAWYGQAEAQLGLENEVNAIAALERVVALDPKRESARTRLDLLRFRQLQSALEGARRARQAGRLAEAETTLEQALALAPTSALVLRELAAVEAARGSLESAEAHARRATQADAADADAHATLGAVLEARRKYREASAAYAKAASLDPRPAWRDKAEVLREKAIDAAVPPEFRELPAAATVTRGQTAAFIGIQLEDLITRAPKRVTAVATDVRGHWAATWILPVTQAGVMDIFPNHTFQPSTNIRRGDLAQIVSQLLALAAGARSPELARWRAAKPSFADLPPTHLSYGAGAIAVASGAMSMRAGNRFAATTPATGRDLTTAIARIDQIAGR